MRGILRDLIRRKTRYRALRCSPPDAFGPKSDECGHGVSGRDAVDLPPLQFAEESPEAAEPDESTAEAMLATIKKQAPVAT